MGWGAQGFRVLGFGAHGVLGFGLRVLGLGLRVFGLGRRLWGGSLGSLQNIQSFGKIKTFVSCEKKLEIFLLRNPFSGKLRYV